MSNTKKAASALSADLQKKIDSLTSTASRVRFLNAEGHPRGDIARILGIRYQWVRNVLITPLKNG